MPLSIVSRALRSLRPISKAPVARAPFRFELGIPASSVSARAAMTPEEFVPKEMIGTALEITPPGKSPLQPSLETAGPPTLVRPAQEVVVPDYTDGRIDFTWNPKLKTFEAGNSTKFTVQQINNDIANLRQNSAPGDYIQPKDYHLSTNSAPLFFTYLARNYGTSRGQVTVDLIPDNNSFEYGATNTVGHDMITWDEFLNALEDPKYSRLKFWYNRNRRSGLSPDEWDLEDTEGVSDLMKDLLGGLYDKKAEIATERMKKAYSRLVEKNPSLAPGIEFIRPYDNVDPLVFFELGKLPIAIQYPLTKTIIHKKGGLFWPINNKNYANRYY